MGQLTRQTPGGDFKSLKTQLDQLVEDGQPKDAQQEPASKSTISVDQETWMMSFVAIFVTLVAFIGLMVQGIIIATGSSMEFDSNNSVPDSNLEEIVIDFNQLTVVKFDNQVSYNMV